MKTAGEASRQDWTSRGLHTAHTAHQQECAFKQSLNSLLNFWGPSISTVCTRKQPCNVHYFQLKPFVVTTHHFFPRLGLSTAQVISRHPATHTKKAALRDCKTVSCKGSKGHQEQETKTRARDGNRRAGRRRKIPSPDSSLYSLYSPLSGRRSGQRGAGHGLCP